MIGAMGTVSRRENAPGESAVAAGYDGVLSQLCEVRWLENETVSRSQIEHDGIALMRYSSVQAPTVCRTLTDRKCIERKRSRNLRNA